MNNVLSPALPRLRFFARKDIETLPQLQRLSAADRRAMDVVARVLPFRVNNYVVDHLIDWNNVPSDPIYQLTFPQPGMLMPEHFARVEEAVENGNEAEAAAVANEIRRELNPHPEGQMQHNMPKLDGEVVPGVQHKYKETVLVFPSAGQTCHAYCSFCFRWAQFVGLPDLKIATDESMRFADYLRRHTEVTDVLITGGDPLVMRADVLARYIEPLLSEEMEHIRTIRIGTKSLSYWPHRFLTDSDTDTLLKLLEKVVASGKHLAFMGHFNHFRELATPYLEKAIGRLRSLGATIRTQSPVIRHINDNADVWSTMWQRQVELGCLPYYMFVERDTGADAYFRVPLHQALDIYREANSQVSGLARTARGPVMSAMPGKVMVNGITEVGGKKVFVLSLLQARDASWCGQPFFAEFDPQAYWLEGLKPAFGNEFFYTQELRRRLAAPTPSQPIVGHALPLPVLTS